MSDHGTWLCLGSITVLLLVVIGQAHSIHVLRRAPTVQPERLLMPSDEVTESLHVPAVTRSTVVQVKALATNGQLTAEQLLLALADPRILGPVMNLLKGDSQMAIADKLAELTNALTAVQAEVAATKAEEAATKQALTVVQTNESGMQAQIAALKQEIDEMGGLQPAIDAAVALLNDAKASTADAKANTKAAQDIATAGAQ